MTSLWYLLGLIQVFLLIPTVKYYFIPLEQFTSLNYFFSAKSLLVLAVIIFIIINIIIKLINKEYSKPKAPKLNYFKNSTENNEGLLIDFIQSLKYIINIFIKIINPIIKILCLFFIYLFWIIPLLIKNIAKEFASISFYIFKPIFSLLLILTFGFIISKNSTFLFNYLNSKLTEESSSYFWNLIIAFCGLLIILILIQLVHELKEKPKFGKLLFTLMYFLFTSTLTGFLYKYITDYEVGLFIYYSSILIIISFVILLFYEYFKKKKGANRVDGSTSCN
jgi:hypothetical protein